VKPPAKVAACKRKRGPLHIGAAGCGGKPAWLNQNRMSSSSKLAEFAARLRGAIQACFSLGKPAPAGLPQFDALARELFALQFELNLPYRRFCEAGEWRPCDIGHWTAIPTMPTGAFKDCELSCLPARERTTVFHSSGTTGHRPSRHYHNSASLAVYEASLLGWFRAHVPMASGLQRRWHMTILTPPPAQAPHSSLVHMFETIRRELGGESSAFVGKTAEDGGWSLDSEAALQRLRDQTGDGQPVLVLGTAFSYVHLLDYMAERGLRFALPAGSCALETGGYKGRSRSLPRTALHGLISQRLGISPDHIICEYGMSELSSQAYDLALAGTPAARHDRRCFHFPPWARVQVVSPEDGHEVGDGETGLIRVFDLANVWSVMAIQTEDLGVRHGDGFALAGRAVMAEPRGCSLMAV